MPTIDWPEALIPQTAQLTLRKAGAQFASPFNGTLQAVDFVGERWTLSASLAQMSARNPRGVGAFCNRLAGGVERVRVWPFHTGGVPRGTMRGVVTLSAAATRGNSVLRVSGAVAQPNLLLNAGMERDANGDALADGWVVGGFGSSGVVSAYSGAGNNSARGQGVFSGALGPLTSDGLSLFTASDVPVVPGQAYSLSADTRDDGEQVWLEIFWKSSGGAVIGHHTQAYSNSFATWTRRVTTAMAPLGAAFAAPGITGRALPGGPGAAALLVDNVQFQQGAQATPYVGEPTLEAGDFIAAGGQLFQVLAACTLASGGVGDVPIVNRVRSTIAAGSPVTWYRPTCEMVLPAMQAGPVHRPGVIESTALDLVEVW